MARNLHLLSLPLSLRAELPNWVSFYFWRAVTVRKLGLFPFMPAGIGSHASATTTPFEPSPNGCGAQLLSLWPALEPIRLAQSSSCKRNSRGGCSSFFPYFHYPHISRLRFLRFGFHCFSVLKRLFHVYTFYGSHSITVRAAKTTWKNC